MCLDLVHRYAQGVTERGPASAKTVEGVSLRREVKLDDETSKLFSQQASGNHLDRGAMAAVDQQGSIGRGRWKRRAHLCERPHRAEW